MDSLSQLDDVSPSYKIATTYSGLKAIIWSELIKNRGLMVHCAAYHPGMGSGFQGLFRSILDFL